jgi:hypothetical protein
VTAACVGPPRRALLVRVTARSRLGVARASSPRVAIPNPGAGPPPERLFRDTFDRPDGLVTNEWAFRHPDDRDAVVSPDWYMTSGSLFTSGKAGWSGVPDRRAPDAASADGTGSAVFRLVTHRRDFGNVAVSFSPRNDAVTSATTPTSASTTSLSRSSTRWPSWPLRLAFLWRPFVSDTSPHGMGFTGSHPDESESRPSPLTPTEGNQSRAVGPAPRRSR